VEEGSFANSFSLASAALITSLLGSSNWPKIVSISSGANIIAVIFPRLHNRLHYSVIHKTSSVSYAHLLRMYESSHRTPDSVAKNLSDFMPHGSANHETYYSIKIDDRVGACRFVKARNACYDCTCHKCHQGLKML
jgi:hypothetical protein